MAAPRVEEEANAISMVVSKWEEGQVEQFSPVYRFDGYPWDLRLEKVDEETINLFARCKKSSEAELWDHRWTEITMRAKHGYVGGASAYMNSWKKPEVRIGSFKTIPEGTRLRATVSHASWRPMIHGDECRRRPILNPRDPLDGILVIGDDKKKIHVNKQSLASQSTFFDRLFNGDYKEKNMDEIPIGEVEYEEFDNIIKLMYRMDGASLTDDNVYNVLELADRFDIKIVEDKVTNYLLSSSSSFSYPQKLLIADQYNLHSLREEILKDVDNYNVPKQVKNSEEYKKMSSEMVRYLFEHCCDELDKY